MSNTRRTTAKTAAEFDWDALLADPQRNTSQVSLCFAADLNREHQALTAELTAMPRPDNDARLGAKSPRVALAEKIQLVEAEMAAAQQTIELRAMRRPDFRALGDAHPPRPNDPLDKLYAVNTETIFPALLAECATSPKRDVAWWQTLLDDVLNQGQWEKLSLAAWNVNRADVVPGFSRLASAVTATTNGKSAPPTR